MKIATGDYSELIAMITVAYGRNLIETQTTAILKALRGPDVSDESLSIHEREDEVPWHCAVAAVERYVRSPSPSRNPYGSIVEALEEECRKNRQRRFVATTWRADPGCLTREEWAICSAVNSEIMLWHTMGLKKARMDRYGTMLPADEWEANGRPPLVTDLCTWWYSGYDEACTKNKLVEYASKCLVALQKARFERTNPKPVLSEAA
jgi:hypothetical protein